MTSYEHCFPSGEKDEGPRDIRSDEKEEEAGDASELEKDSRRWFIDPGEVGDEETACVGEGDDVSHYDLDVLLSGGTFR